MNNFYERINSSLAIALLIFFFGLNTSAKDLAGDCSLRAIAGNENNFDTIKNLFIDNTVVDFPKITLCDKTVFQLVTHGRPGELLIEGSWLNASQIASFIKKRLGSCHNVLYLNIYGCNFAKGKKGRKAVVYLERNLNMHVAASSNITGLGGDWRLEVGVSKNVLHPKYAYNLQAGCFTSGTNEGKLFSEYYRFSPSVPISESTPYNLAPNFSTVDPVTGYPTSPETPTPSHTGTIEDQYTFNAASYGTYDNSSSAELAIGNLFISKKKMDCILGFTDGSYSFRFLVTGFSRQHFFVDTTGASNSINGDWQSSDYRAMPGANPLMTESFSVQATNPTDWIFIKGYIIDATMLATFSVQYKHSSQSTWTNVPANWVYPAQTNTQICLKDTFPTNLMSSNGNTICLGQSTVLTANCAMSGSTLVWYSDPSLTTPLASTTVTPSVQTTYYAVCEQNGCKSQSASITITPATPPTPIVSANNVSNICPASTVNLNTLTTASSGITYEWHSANNTNSNTLVANSASVGVGIYYVFSKNAGGCYSASAAQVSVAINSCSNPDTITIMVNCASCSVTGCPTANDLPVGLRTYSSCSVPAGFTAGSPNAQGCITYTSTASGNDTARTCIVACSGGACDTSFFNILRTMVLPVTVTHFYGEKNKDGTNTLSWITVNEDGIQDYVVESSQNQINWKIAGSKHALKKTGKLIYSVTDQTTYGHDFYRLKIFDENGNVQTFPKIVHLNNDLSEVGQMKVFPNPAQTTLNVQYLSSLSNATLQLTICDISGKKIYKFTHKISTGNNAFPLDIAELDNGIYILNYHNAQNGVSGQIKFVKESNQ